MSATTSPPVTPVAAPEDDASARRRGLIIRIVAVAAMPLFFMITFSLCYVSALHEPTPHDMAVTVAGAPATTARIASEIEKVAPHAFDVTRTSSAAVARQRVADRRAYGAVIVQGDRVTTVVASAAGQVAKPVMLQIGAQVAEGLETTPKVVDVAPTTADDATGTVLFYLLVGCTVPGFLAVTALAQVFGRPRTLHMVVTNVITAIVIPIVVFAGLSIFIGDFDSTFGTIAAVLGVAMLYTLTVGLIATFLTRLIGVGAVFIEILFVVAFNFTTAGGSIPAGMLPPFWQALHEAWVGAGALESWRSLVYFSGEQFGRWFAQLAIWAGAAALLVVGVAVLDTIRSRRAPAEDEPPGTTPIALAADESAEAAAVGAGVA